MYIKIREVKIQHPISWFTGIKQAEKSGLPLIPVISKYYFYNVPVNNFN
jgi:hypothetical protein